MKFYKILTFSYVDSGQNRSCISNKARVIPLPETFLMTSCTTETETASRM